jgi:undecaprenyl diphosphate synthase
MDGNGRWATSRAMPRAAGHRAGVDAMRRIVEAAPDLGITTLTLFAFSSDNWKRPQNEVSSLMWLLRAYLQIETRRFIDSGSRLIVVGRRDRLTARLRTTIRRVERATAHCRRLTVRVALDYSSRDSILRAASRLPPGQPCSREDFARLIAYSDAHADKSAPPDSEVDLLIRPTTEAAPDHWVKGSPFVDLLIRTGGEKRLSDFMLWESAYAELVFTDQMWPDFGPNNLREAVEEFHRRDRRYGALEITEAPSNEESPSAIVPLPTWEGVRG